MKTPSQAKRIVIGLVGGTVVLIGLALIVLPGPAFIVIPAGLAILATEFAWAKRWLNKIKGMVGKNSSKEPAKAEQKTAP